MSSLTITFHSMILLQAIDTSVIGVIPVVLLVDLMDREVADFQKGRYGQPQSETIGRSQAIVLCLQKLYQIFHFEMPIEQYH